MQLKVDFPEERSMTITADIDWFQQLYNATRQGRRSVMEQAILTDLGNQLAHEMTEISTSEKTGENPNDD